MSLSWNIACIMKKFALPYGTEAHIKTYKEMINCQLSCNLLLPFVFLLSLSLFLVVVPLCGDAVQTLSLQTRLVWNSQKSACVCFLNAAPPLPGLYFFLKTGSHHVAWAALPSIGIKGQMIKSTVGTLTEILKRKYRKRACRDTTTSTPPPKKPRQWKK